MTARTEWARAYHGARIGIQHPPMVRPAGVPRRTWRLAVACVLWRAKHNMGTLWPEWNGRQWANEVARNVVVRGPKVWLKRPNPW